VEQPIAATDSSPNTLPEALDPSASSISPAALDPSANSLLSATLDLCLARPSLSAGLGLHSASTTKLSAALDLHSASCFNSNKTCSASQLAANEHKGLFNCKTASTFKLIFGFKQQYQSQLQHDLDLVDLSLSNAFLITQLELISIKARAHAACRFFVKLDAAAKGVQAVRLPTLVSVPMPHFEGA
jgi:hypothetical protein